MVFLDNIQDGEQIHQRCVLVRGRVHHDINKTVQVSTSNESGVAIFPDQHWPVSQGIFRALLMLSPGTNIVEFRVLPSIVRRIKLTYIPLLQTPPLHLAIMIAKDSPLLVDCPPSKQASLTSTHSSLDAVVAKLRMTAYMWQAYMADGFYWQGFGRRSFRIEEEWSIDTVSKHYLPSQGMDGAMQSTAKVHLVRSNKTVAELHAVNATSHATLFGRRQALHEIFADALRDHGGVFTATTNPLVAGLVLDSHYSREDKTVLGHAVQACHDPNGISLGVMSSHLTYAWPRFVEEVADCLLDTTSPGVSVSNENGDCKSMWEVCAVGQEKFLRKIECAMGISRLAELAAHESSTHWAQTFLPPTAHSGTKDSEIVAYTTDISKDESKWDIRAALKLQASKHFWLPGDRPIEHIPGPWVEFVDHEFSPLIDINNKAGIAKIWIGGEEYDRFDRTSNLRFPLNRYTLTLAELEAQFDRSKPLEMEILDMNGSSEICDLWSCFKARNHITVPGTSIKLLKKLAKPGPSEDNTTNRWRWAVMLQKRSENGALVKATQVDIRVGAILDGAEVYYRDGSKIPCGPLWDEHGHECYMGGHQAKKLGLPKSTEIVKVAVNVGEGLSSPLNGLRMWRSDGKALGALNTQDRTRANVIYLEPDEGHRVIGFYGQSTSWGFCAEFGIVTAPKDVDLPDSVYDLPELQNTDGGPDAWPRGRKVRKRRFEEVDSSDSDEISEDEDEGYDYDEGDDTVDEDN